MKIGKLDIKKAYYGSKELTTNNAFVGSVPLIDTPPTGWVTFKANQSSTIGLNRLSSYQKLLYSNNKKDWNVFDTSTSINMNAGDEIYVAGILKQDINSSNYTNFSITGNVSVSGNIVYLWNYNNSKALLKQYCGFNLFNGCTGITDASELTLGTSDTKLAESCYRSMFTSCTSLTTAPELPATILAQNCYAYMFQDCTSLTTSPELPATTLSVSCYYGMFYNCTGLTVAPELPATTLGWLVYDKMFNGCSNLKYIKCLAVNGINQNYSTDNWVSGVSSTGTFISNVDSSWPTGIHGIPEGWDNSQKEFAGLTFTAREASTVGINNYGDNAPDLWYAINGGSWVHWSDTYETVSLNQNDVMWVKGNNPHGFSFSESEFSNFNSTGEIDVSGNIMSLIDNGACNTLTIPCDYCFYKLFFGNSSIKSVSFDLLPATTLTPHCYQYMFNGCRGLTQAPKLPATTLEYACYSSMLRYCTSLTSAPELPATMLADYCYDSIFLNCTNLTTAPELPATTLAPYCYQYMFQGCSNLTTAPELPAMNLADNCYLYMFSGCGLTTAPELPATTLARACYNYMFSGCTSLTIAPELPATTLAQYCYQYMFQYCSSLNYIKCLATDISAYRCTYNWVSGVASTGTFVKDPKANWSTGTSGIPTNWTATEEFKGLKFEAIEDSEFSWSCNSSSFENKFYYSLDDGKTWANYTAPIPFSKGTILCLKGDYPEGLSNSSRTVRFALSGKVKASGNIMSLIDNGACNTLTIPSNYCFRELFMDCTSLITPPELPATILTTYCYRSMFYGCTSLTSVLELPAITLAENCYAQMFYNCASLTTAPELPATTLKSMCYDSMFRGCISLVYPPSLPATTLAYACYASMFKDCSSLVYPPVLPANTLVMGCYSNMFCNCRNLIIAPELSATTLPNSCYEYMFQECRSLIKAPVLPATTLSDRCYYAMFEGCSNLKYIKCFATDISASNCTYYWVSGVPSTGTFVKNPDANWPTGTSGIPSSWEVVDAK